MTSAAVNLASPDTIVTSPNKGDNPQVGQPSVASLARGILANTGIQQANSKLAHMCDFSQDVRRSALLKKYLKAIANSIRQGIRAVMKFLGLSDSSGVFSQTINYLKNKLQEVNNFLKNYIKKIKDFLTFVTTFITLVAAIIQWILNLPANIKALLIDCLKKLTKAIAGVLVDSWKESATETPITLSSDVTGLLKEAGDLVKNAAQVNALVGVAQTTAAFATSTVNQTATSLNTTVNTLSSTSPSSNTVDAKHVTTAAASPTNNQDIHNANTVINLVQSSNPSSSNVANNASNTVSIIQSSGP
jgi:hypothetical protein